MAYNVLSLIKDRRDIFKSQIDKGYQHIDFEITSTFVSYFLKRLTEWCDDEKDYNIDTLNEIYTISVEICDLANSSYETFKKHNRSKENTHLLNQCRDTMYMWHFLHGAIACALDKNCSMAVKDWQNMTLFSDGLFINNDPVPLTKDNLIAYGDALFHDYENINYRIQNGKKGKK